MPMAIEQHGKLRAPLTQNCTDCTLVYMKRVTATEFRNRASALLDMVQQGETVEVYRHGQAVARLIPASADRVPSWKQPKPRIQMKGVSLSKLIIEERRRSKF